MIEENLKDIIRNAENTSIRLNTAFELCEKLIGQKDKLKDTEYETVKEYYFAYQYIKDSIRQLVITAEKLMEVYLK